MGRRSDAEEAAQLACEAAHLAKKAADKAYGLANSSQDAVVELLDFEEVSTTWRRVKRGAARSERLATDALNGASEALDALYANKSTSKIVHLTMEVQQKSSLCQTTAFKTQENIIGLQKTVRQFSVYDNQEHFSAQGG